MRRAKQLVGTTFVEATGTITASITFKTGEKTREVAEGVSSKRQRIRELGFSWSKGKEARKLAPEVRIKQIGMREDLLSIIRHTSSDHFSEEL